MLLGLFMLLACSIHLAVIPRGKGALQVFVLIFCGRFLIGAKAQMLTALPIVLLLIIVFALYHRPLYLRKLIPYTFMIMIGCTLIAYETIKIYQDNSSISARQTTWASVFYGALMISNDPLGDMEELGIDVRMQPDIGKDAYHPDEDYVISPNTKEADVAFYDHVNTFTMVKYYLKRPLLLLKMLNYAAGESREVYNDFRAYLGQDYSSVHDPVQRFGLWLYWRRFFTFGSFGMYVLVYGAILYWGIVKVLIKPDVDYRTKLLVCIYLGVLFIGSVQYPLSVVGNGFADNHKQMFGFMMCHDALVISGIPLGLKNLVAYFRREKKERRYMRFWEKIRENKNMPL